MKPLLPTATYRLQMHAGFNLKAAIAIVPYLDSLGISHLYVSSLLTAKPGSTHGYDVCDHRKINPEIGTEEELRALSQELKRRGMGLILDVVPNHMSVGGHNAWWSDVLENGPSSQYANYFDIAWNDHYRESLRGKVLLPMLGTTYGEAVESKLFLPSFAMGAFALQFKETQLPIDPRTYGAILDPVLEEQKSAQETLSPATLELQSILGAIRHLPPRGETDCEKVTEGRYEIGVIKRRLQEWSAWDPAGAGVLARHLEELAADPVRSDQLIESQAYRPCYWRVASDEINYRRFFDVNDLAALSTERPEVFEDIHHLIFEWLDAGIIDGLRIDHPDGLYDPQQYLDRLQQRWRNNADKPPLYVVVEKILGPREQLPKEWATAGTTGYEFLNAVNGLFVDPAGEVGLTKTFEQFTGCDTPFDEMVYRKKFLILQSSLTSELHVLAGHFDRLAQSDRSSRDFTLNSLRHSLREVLCCFPVYRTYIRGEASEKDQSVVKRAVRLARRHNPLLERAIFDFLRDTLLLKDPPSGPASEEYRAAQIRCTARFQQLAAPVMAKGYEDTAFYLYNRLTSLNEVGGDPKSFGRKPADVHAFLERRGPGGLSPLATHDTKRGEDVRARINVLSEIPQEWAERVNRWKDLNARHRMPLDDDVLAPDGNEEYLLYQTLIGTWIEEAPSAGYITRIRDYMTKAVQEQKVHSSWINPDADYIQAVTQFVDRIFDSQSFLDDLRKFVQRIRTHAALNALAQTLIQCTAPGVPDIYQGNELQDTHLVDPDNRGPVDFQKRIELLNSRETNTGNWCDDLTCERCKLQLISRALRLRRDHKDVFSEGDYCSLKTEGSRADHLFAFLRAHKDQAFLIAVPRLTVSLFGNGKITSQAWGDTRLTLLADWQSRRWIEAFSGRSMMDRNGGFLAADLFADSPVTLWRTE